MPLMLHNTVDVPDSMWDNLKYYKMKDMHYLKKHNLIQSTQIYLCCKYFRLSHFTETHFGHTVQNVLNSSINSSLIFISI